MWGKAKSNAKAAHGKGNELNAERERNWHGIGGWEGGQLKRESSSITMHMWKGTRFWGDEVTGRETATGER
jgi:hypothetical protein